MKYSLQDEEDIERQVGRSAFFAMTDSIIDTQSAIKVLSITVTAEIGVLAMFYFSKDQVFEFLKSGDNVWFYATIGVFVVGFLTAFAAFRLLPRSFPRPFFRYTIWIISIASGIANVVLFFVLTNFQIR
jgi:hypothetical protein